MYETTVFQINLGHRRAASCDLQLRTNEMADFIALIQEPWMVRGKMVGLNSSHKKIVANCDNKTPARAAIYHHKDSRVAPHPAFTGRDVAAGVWNIDKPNLPQIMLVSIYWPRH